MDLERDAADLERVDDLRSALDAFEAKPSRAAFSQLGEAADALVDATIGARRVSRAFAEHGHALLERFGTWAALVPVAVHEAAHVVAGHALGRAATRATIVPDEPSGEERQLGAVYGLDAPVRYADDDPARAARESAIIAAAGEIADAPLRSPTSPGARARRWYTPPVERATGYGTDADRWLRAAYECETEDDVLRVLARWRRETAALLARHAGAVERVAAALLVHRDLDAGQLADLLGPIPGGDG